MRTSCTALGSIFPYRISTSDDALGMRTYSSWSIRASREIGAAGLFGREEDRKDRCPGFAVDKALADTGDGFVLKGLSSAGELCRERMREVVELISMSK